MDGDFYTTLRWRLLRGFMLWFYGRRCMRCGSAYRVEVDHIVARARGEFGREYQWMPRNLQILCREHNREKMTKFDDWRPLWARVLMPVRDTPAVHRAGAQQPLGAHDDARHCRGGFATTPVPAVQVGRLHPFSPYSDRMSEEEGITQPSRHALPYVRQRVLKPVDHHWPSRTMLGRLVWDVGVILAVVSLLLLVARIVGHCAGFKWR